MNSVSGTGDTSNSQIAAIIAAREEGNNFVITNDCFAKALAAARIPTCGFAHFMSETIIIDGVPHVGDRCMDAECPVVLINELRDDDMQLIKEYRLTPVFFEQ